MSNVWIVLGLCVIVLLGAALPLLRDRHHGHRPLSPTHSQSNGCSEIKE